jgi:hypothetical protein
LKDLYKKKIPTTTTVKSASPLKKIKEREGQMEYISQIFLKQA